ncbi:DUF4915 domain-containing protein [Thiothrix sp. UBA2332]|uniref:DUF4915 domain-containing protein n=1 Tax=Thiothrix sp. UBA2332 TaxID=1947696 RepID=UPI0025CEBE75|nr:DUF4915 domain-containing protein [Thiothrix sp. UBA2332]HRK77999.1 DUF4915 domain-containing protein [Thiobacillus sp.]
MNVDPLFQNLLISSPNGGGLFAVRCGEVIHVDGKSSTGIDLRGDCLLRAMQPSGWIYYGSTPETTLMAPIAVPDIHDALLVDDGFLVVCTEGNEVVRYGRDFAMERQWRFGGAPDSMHVNCLANWNGRIVFSAFGAFATHHGYKAGTMGTGFVRDLETGETLIAGLSQPHNPTPLDDGLLLADSERLSLVLYDGSGAKIREANLDGYTRGVAVNERTIFVGLSCSRNIEGDAEGSACVVALDRHSWKAVARISIPAREIYDIRIAADARTLDAVLEKIARTVPRKLRAHA